MNKKLEIENAELKKKIKNFVCSYGDCKGRVSDRGCTIILIVSTLDFVFF